jgi:antitoxin component YwqK of YwqJK toxin-antitoxin module
MKNLFIGIFLLVSTVTGYRSYSQALERVTYYDIDSIRVKEQYDVVQINSSEIIREGSFRSYYYSGELRSEGFYVNNKPAGIWKYYYENGSIKMEGEVRNLSNYGHWTYFHENGTKRMEGKLSDGKRVGNWLFYYETGELKSEGEFVDGIREGLWSYFYPEGEIKAQAYYRNGRGDYKEYYTKGEIKMEGLNYYGKSDSLWRFYFETGILKAEGNYQKGMKDGFWKYYHPNGALAAQGNYIDGTEYGKWKYFYENGEVSAEGIEKDGLKEGYWKLYYETGELKGDGFFEAGSGKYKEYYPSGMLKIDGYQKEGKNHGRWNYYYEGGMLEGKCDFVEGEGTYIGYYESGAVKTEGTIRNDRKVGKWKLYNPDGTLAGYYNPVYEDNLPAYKISEARETVVPPRLDYEKPEYRYKAKKINYFTERINEYKGWIIAANPLFAPAGFIPFGLERFKQERLGYELLLTYIRNPFFRADSEVDLGKTYKRGFSGALRQKFYHKNRKLGMPYFGHQFTYVFLNHSSNYVDSVQAGLPVMNVQARENRYEYGAFVGTRFIKDETRGGFTVDLWVGLNIGYRSVKDQYVVNELTTGLLDDIERDKTSVQINFGLNFGFLGPIKRTSTF